MWWSAAHLRCRRGSRCSDEQPKSRETHKSRGFFGGIDITKSIQPYLLSISYTDNEEDETDDLQIKIQDRDDLWLTQWLDEISEKLSWASPSGGSASGDAVVSEAKQIPRHAVCLGRQQSERL